MTAPRFPSFGSSWRLRLGALVVLCASAAPAGAQSVWELTPYRIRVVLAMGRAPELTDGLRADLEQGLVGRVDALIGAAWVVNVAPATGALRLSVLRDVEAVSVEQLEEELAKQESPGGDVAAADRVDAAEDAPAEDEAARAQAAFDLDDLDKVILLAVAPRTAGFRVVARELDVRTRQWNAPAAAPVWNLGKLCDAAFGVMLKAFAPLARIVEVEENDVTLRVRAAGFPPRDPTMVSVRPGDVFRPVVRHNDRYGKLRATLPIQWTFLTVEEVAPGGLECTLHTGLRSPLSGRRRGRYEQLALAVSPPRRPTRLVLRSRTEPHDPLLGYDVYAHAPHSKKTEPVGRTDRLGAVVVPPAERALRVLLVKHGGEFLARLPIVPGLETELTADVRNDDERLEAEGFIRGLQEELIDLVTRREVLMTQIRSRLEEEKFDEAEKLLAELRSLETRDDFALYLEQQQKKVFSADKLAQAKIDQMFSKTRKLVVAYLDPAPVEQLDRQLREARTSPGPF